MGLIRNVLTAAAALALAGTGAAWLFRTTLAEAAFKRAVERNVGRDASEGLVDGIHVFVCGAGSPLPDSKRAGPCLAVIAGDQKLVFDAGSGGVRNLTRMGYPVGGIDAVFLTHLHSDHIDGLGELLMQAWVNGGRSEPMPVFGPVGVDDVVGGFNAAYRLDATYRTAHHGPDIAKPAGHGGAPVPVALAAGPGSAAVIHEADGTTVTAFRVDHAPVQPAFGYRIDYAGRSVTLSGDTIYTPELVAAAQSTDLLFHEALHPGMVREMQAAAAARGRDDLAKILGDILDYHATPADAARAAEESGAGRLVFYHTVPPLPFRALEALFVRDARPVYSGHMNVAADGQAYTLPAGGDDIRIGEGF